MSKVNRAIVVLKKARPRKNALVLCPGINLRTGIEDFASVFPGPTSLEEDVLLVAATIYACDIAFKRSERENIARDIKVTIPVVNLRAFLAGKLHLESLLWFVSRDNWTINFTKADGSPEEAREWKATQGKTLLFSGGLDSLAGAVDLLDKARDTAHVQLVSHVTANPITRSSQKELLSYLKARYGEIDHLVVRSGGRNYQNLTFPADEEREETQRTRSFTYLAIAILAARRRGWNKIVMMAENGQMAIHLALSAARVGAFSTRTAHPDFIRNVEDYFTALLEYPIEIENPYAYRTKAEVIEELVRKHSEALRLAVSCWRGARLRASYKHCGDCVPCLIRRIAIEHHNIQLNEYERDLLSLDIAALPEDDEGKRNAMELAQFAHAFLSRSPAELESEYSDMISLHIDRAKTIELYQQFAVEARAVWGRYPGAGSLVSPLPKGLVARTLKRRRRK